jgi:hypothetical protein
LAELIATAKAYPEAKPFDEPVDLWATPEEVHPKEELGPLPPLDDAWDGPVLPQKKARGKANEEVIHRICGLVRDGYKTPNILSVINTDFPDVKISKSLIADVRNGWLHHSIVKQYGIKPQHRSLKKAKLDAVVA